MITDKFVATARHQIYMTHTRIQSKKRMFRAPGTSSHPFAEWRLRKQMDMLMEDATNQLITYNVMLMEDGRLRARQYTLRGKLSRASRETKLVSIRVKLIRTIDKRIALAQGEQQRSQKLEKMSWHDTFRYNHASTLISQLTDELGELHELSTHI